MIKIYGTTTLILKVNYPTYASISASFSKKKNSYMIHVLYKQEFLNLSSNRQTYNKTLLT
jgi:hypothetical protein